MPKATITTLGQTFASKKEASIFFRALDERNRLLRNAMDDYDPKGADLVIPDPVVSLDGMTFATLDAKGISDAWAEQQARNDAQIAESEQARADAAAQHAAQIAAQEAALELRLKALVVAELDARGVKEQIA